MADVVYRGVCPMTRAKARLQLVMTYRETGNISETACRWHTWRQAIPKWFRRYEAEGISGLEDRAQRPRHSPRQTYAGIEDQVLRAWRRTRATSSFATSSFGTNGIGTSSFGTNGIGWLSSGALHASP